MKSRIIILGLSIVALSISACTKKTPDVTPIDSTKKDTAAIVVPAVDSAKIMDSLKMVTMKMDSIHKADSIKMADSLKKMGVKTTTTTTTTTTPKVTKPTTPATPTVPVPVESKPRRNTNTNGPVESKPRR